MQDNGEQMLHNNTTDYGKYLFTNIFINLCLGTIKLVGGILGHSQALIADAIESFSDIFYSLCLFSGIAISKQPPDQNHPYGHGKAESLSAVIGALFMLGSAIVIIHTSFRQIVTPHQVPETFTIIILIGVIFTKEFLYRFLKSKSKYSTALLVDAWHQRSDALTSLAAVIGISVAIVGGKSFAVADDYAALIAALIIIISAVKLLGMGVNELMDKSPQQLSYIKAKINSLSKEWDLIETVSACQIRKDNLQEHR